MQAGYMEEGLGFWTEVVQGAGIVSSFMGQQDKKEERKRAARLERRRIALERERIRSGERSSQLAFRSASQAQAQAAEQARQDRAAFMSVLKTGAILVGGGLLLKAVLK